MSRFTLAVAATAIILLAGSSPSLGFSSRPAVLTVYSNGYVLITQTLAVDPRATSIEVPLFAPEVSSLVATDQNGSPLSYGFPSGGGNLTIYTLGASGVTLSYDTDTLTTKNGSVWTLAFSSSSASTVALPQFASLGSVSGTPSSINQTNGSYVLGLPPGSWKVSYGVPLQTTPSVTVTTTTGGGQVRGGVAGLSDLQLEAVVAAAIAAAAGVIALWRWSRGGIGPVSKDLRPDDLQVLNFIREKGGRVLEPEIRARFVLPKTSAWRQIKRLERLGYVRVTKVGSQNQIELVKERASPG